MGTAAGLNNYTRNTKDIFDYNVIVGRVDHTFSDKNRAFVRLSYDRYLETDSAFSNNIAGGLDLKRINRGGVIDDVMVLSPSTVLDLRYGLTQEETPEFRPSRGMDLKTLGFSSNLLSLLDPSHPDVSPGLSQHQGPHRPLHRQLHRDVLRLRQLQHRRRHSDRHRPRLGRHPHPASRQTHLTLRRGRPSLSHLRLRRRVRRLSAAHLPAHLHERPAR